MQIRMESRVWPRGPPKPRGLNTDFILYPILADANLSAEFALPTKNGVRIMSSNWRGVFPAATTQYASDGSVDLKSTRHLVESMMDAGVHGLIMLGSVGENTVLEPAEKMAVIKMAKEAAKGRIPVLSGVAENSTPAACRYAKACEDAGLDGLMVLPGMIYKADSREAIEHFRTVAKATSLPIMIYNNPPAYNVDLKPDDLKALADQKNLICIKESAGNSRRFTDLINTLGDRYILFCGLDDLVLEAAALGAVGWVSGFTDAFPREIGQAVGAAGGGQIRRGAADLSLVHAGPASRRPSQAGAVHQARAEDDGRGHRDGAHAAPAAGGRGARAHHRTDPKGDRYPPADLRCGRREADMAERRALVVGAGIIGIHCAIALRRRGFAVTVIDERGPGEGTSFGNAGCIAHTGVLPVATPGLIWQVPGMLMDPLGPLSIRWSYLPQLAPWLWQFLRAGAPARYEEITAALATLIGRVWTDWDSVIAEAGISDLFTRRGALYVYETDQGFASAAAGWDLRARHGIRAQRVDARQIAELEPMIAPIFRHGYLVEDPGHVADPYKVVLRLAAHFQRSGGEIKRGRVVGFEGGAPRRP